MSRAAELPIRLEDEALLVVAKPAGLTVHGGAGTAGDTLIDQLAVKYPELAGLERMGLVHRLDKGTSGLLLVAKTAKAKQALGAQFADRTVTKRYVAVVEGCPDQAQGVIDAPIARHHADRKRMAVRPDGREARTEYAVRQRLEAASVLDVRPTTGRTHQIRVHLAALGYPIIGDGTYGSNRSAARQLLHAAELTFNHPGTGEQVTVTEPLPDDMVAFIKEHHAQD